MNIIFKNKYIKLPTHEPEAISQIYCPSSKITKEKKIISKIKRELIIYNIIISIIIILFVVAASEKFKDKKWKRKSKDLKSKINEGIQIKKQHHKFIETCIEGKLLFKIDLNKIINPKISVIIPVYNKEIYILRILRSIQNQNFEDIEIIFMDDCSKDKSVSLIEKYQKEDQRIRLIKHEKNVGTLINRNEGALNAKGEYILFIDTDDLLLNDILNTTYYFAKKYNLDIIQFRAYWGYYLSNVYKYDDYGYIHKSNIKHQPELSDLMYYEYPDKILQTEYNLWGKLIKKEIYIKTLDKIDKKYLEQHMTLHEDGMILFILFKVAKSYLYLDRFGMFYSRNENSALAGLRKNENVDKTVRDSFLYLKFMYEYTKENKKEKDMAVYQFKFILQQFESIFNEIKSGFNFIYDVIDLYLNCDLISDDDKEIFRKAMDKIARREQNIKSKNNE